MEHYTFYIWHSNRWHLVQDNLPARVLKHFDATAKGMGYKTKQTLVQKERQ